MATRKPAANREGERIAVLETKFDALKDTVEVGFRELRELIETQSMNGETPRVKNISKRLGDPADVEVLAAMVESRRRWAWALRPVTAAGAQMRAAFLWGGGALLLAWAHSVLHTAWPHVVP